MYKGVIKRFSVKTSICDKYVGTIPALQDAGHIVECVGQGCKTGLKGSDHPTIRPCIGPAPGSHGRARRTLVFCFYDMQGAGMSNGRSILKEIASQTTFEASYDQSISSITLPKSLSKML